MSLYTSVLKQVLVATDLTSHSDRAIGRALQLAAAHDAALNIVHVMEEGLPEEAQALVSDNARDALRQTLTALPLAQTVRVTVDLVVGIADTDIVERAVMTNADCIVLALHDRLLEENLPIEGTLAESVIAGTNLPVLLVRNAADEAYRSAVVGIEFSALSQAALQAAVLVAPTAKLHLVHAYEAGSPEETEMARDGLARFVAAEAEVFERAAAVAGLPEIAVTMHAEAGDAQEVLKRQITETGADLLVLGTHGRTGLTRSLLGSVATDLINERLSDVLVIRPD